MTDHDALLWAIISAPEDDWPRLVLADWMEENGQQERAEFVRVQVELAEHPRQVAWLEQMPVEQWSGSEDEGELLRRLEILRRRERELLLAPSGQPCLTNRGWWTKQAVGEPLYSRLEHQVVFRRGFVEAVACTCADWCGGPCRWCKGSGDYEGSHGKRQKKCPDCRGTGHVGGHGPAIVRAQPVRQVRLTDREPLYRQLTGEYVWLRAMNSRQRRSHYLPKALFLCLPDRQQPEYFDERYPTPDATQQALSTAAILWANRAAWKCPACDGAGGFEWRNTHTSDWKECADCRGAGWFIGAPESQSANPVNSAAK